MEVLLHAEDTYQEHYHAACYYSQHHLRSEFGFIGNSPKIQIILLSVYLLSTPQD